MRLGLRGGVRNRTQGRLLLARLAPALAGAAVLVAAALASPLSAQEPEGSAETDRAALMAIYEALNGPEWVDTRWGDEAVGLGTNWGSEEPIATWLGVTTDADGRVTGLELSRRLGDLTGTLPAQLGDLGMLETLTLSSLELSGLPPELGNLTNLRSLTLTLNQLGGPLPPELGNLPAVPHALIQQVERTAAARAGQPCQPGVPGRLLQRVKRTDPARAGQPHQAAVPVSHLQRVEWTDPARAGQPRQLAGVDSVRGRVGPIPPELGQLANLQPRRCHRGSTGTAIPPELTPTFRHRLEWPIPTQFRQPSGSTTG